MIRMGIFFLMLSLLGCSSAKVLNTETEEGADLRAYKTFDFFEVKASGDTSSARFNDRIQKLEDAIAIELQEYGYLLSKTNPDLMVNIGIVVSEQVQTRQTDFRTDAPRYIGQRNYSWKSKEVETGRYREGTVNVELVDAKLKKLVWRGAVQDVLPEKESKLDQRIKEGIQKLFADFPTQKKP